MFVRAAAGFLPQLPRAGKTMLPPAHKPDMGKHDLRRLAVWSCAPQIDVEAWRLRRLLDAGFARPQAERLVSTPAIDLHALLELVDRGCPPHLAARILAPLDEPDL